MRAWRLDCPRQTLVLAAPDDGLPEIVHWGAALPDNEDLAAIARAHRIEAGGGTLMEPVPLSIAPEASRTFQGQPGMTLRALTGTLLSPRFCFACETSNSIQSLNLSFTDDALGLTYAACFELDQDTHVITAQAELFSEQPIHVSWFAAPVFPAPAMSREMIDYHGRWTGEFYPVVTPWGPGIREREARTGRSGHEHFPGLIVPENGASHTKGAAHAFHYGWSGGHRMVAEELPDGRRQIQFGHARDSELAPVTHFKTAKLFATFGEAGLNGCATAFQRHLRDRVVPWPAPERPRPVHYNCWEAIYFDHDLAALKDIATQAAELGAERFVLDDGWFGRRDNDLSSLGDWDIDRRKWPDGLAPLIEHVKARGMTFGLWFEPEMINPDSDLYRAHPDWALGAPDQVLGRNQMALDMAREDVRSHLFEKIDAILKDYDIEYVKWDHNRILPSPDAAQARGSYALLARIREANPTLEIESCASGGGRIDFGVLEHTHRVWLSDSNDALERLRMQHEAAAFLPSVVTGSHVGPRRCHTSGRILDISLRAWVAAQRHMGFEMDPRELDEREKDVLKTVTTWYKANRDWMHAGDILRLDAADDALVAEEQIARDQSRFVVFAAKIKNSRPSTQLPLRLCGLDPTARYRISVVSHRANPGQRGKTALHDGPIEASGAWLMGHGLQLPTTWPGVMWVLEGARL
ncbi:MAG: alpha-galactosidase [Pseudomonadota bacterium]